MSIFVFIHLKNETAYFCNDLLFANVDSITSLLLRTVRRHWNRNPCNPWLVSQCWKLPCGKGFCENDNKVFVRICRSDDERMYMCAVSQRTELGGNDFATEIHLVWPTHGNILVVMYGGCCLNLRVATGLVCASCH